MRVSDADRESAMTALGEHMSTGRLTVDEYGERAALVAAAKTRQDLFAPFGDLPEPWPKLSGVGATTQTPVSQQPAAAPLARSRPGTGWAVAALIPLTWLVAFPVVFMTGYWVVFLIPILLTVLGAVLLGRGVHRIGRRVAANFSQSTGFTGFGGDRYERYAAHWERRATRFAQRAGWQAEMMGQLNEHIQRSVRQGMRSYGRGGRYRRHHHGRR